MTGPSGGIAAGVPGAGLPAAAPRAGAACPAAGPWPARGELSAVRHGESLANAAFAAAEASGAQATGLDCRDADVPLSPAGRLQAAALGRRLGECPPGAVFCSPYLRARQTWHVIAGELARGGLRPPCRIDGRLRDRDMGQLELLTPGMIRRRFPQEARRMEEIGEFRYRPPGGESLADVAARIGSFLGELDLGARPLLVVHDAVVAVLRHLIESVPGEELARLPLAANASVTTWAVRAGVLRLTAYSDVRHLRRDGRAP